MSIVQSHKSQRAELQRRAMKSEPVSGTSVVTWVTALEKAARGFASCTELAARIHRQIDLSYRTAQRIVGNLVLRTYKRGKHATDADLINESAREDTGHDLGIDDDTA